MKLFLPMIALINYARAASTEQVAVLVDQLIEDEHERTPKGMGFVSPQCWHRAISMLSDQEIHAESAAALCARLPEAHQKRLALEIAQCHMHDLGKQLYTSPAIQRECSTGTIDREIVQMCLKHLTDSGEKTYTHYIIYVQILCTRMTQELFLQHQESIKKDISSKYAEISVQSIEHLEAIHRMSEAHAKQLKVMAEIPQLIQEQLTDDLKDHLKDTLQETMDEQLKDRLDNLLKEQATEQATFVSTIMDRLQHRDEEERERQEDWTHYQSTMLLQQTREMERQRKALLDHRSEMEDLAEAVSATTLNMQPLMGLQSLINIATEGYSWITFLLYFILTFNIVWAVTRHERCQAFRSHLFGLVLAEAILELALTGAVQYDLLTNTHRAECIAHVRQWALLAESIMYVFGIVVSCFTSSGGGGRGKMSTEDANEEVERLLDERLALNRSHDYRRASPRSFASEELECPAYKQRQQQQHSSPYQKHHCYPRRGSSSIADESFVAGTPHQDHHHRERTPWRTAYEQQQYFEGDETPSVDDSGYSRHLAGGSLRQSARYESPQSYHKTLNQPPPRPHLEAPPFLSPPPPQVSIPQSPIRAAKMHNAVGNAAAVRGFTAVTPTTPNNATFAGEKRSINKKRKATKSHLGEPNTKKAAVSDSDKL